MRYLQRHVYSLVLLNNSRPTEVTWLDTHGPMLRLYDEELSPLANVNLFAAYVVETKRKHIGVVCNAHLGDPTKCTFGISRVDKSCSVDKPGNSHSAQTHASK